MRGCGVGQDGRPGEADSAGGRFAGVPAWRPLDPGNVDCSLLLPILLMG
jgi:hypothetical protein